MIPYGDQFIQGFFPTVALLQKFLGHMEKVYERGNQKMDAKSNYVTYNEMCELLNDPLQETSPRGGGGIAGGPHRDSRRKRKRATDKHLKKRQRLPAVPTSTGASCTVVIDTDEESTAEPDEQGSRSSDDEE